MPNQISRRQFGLGASAVLLASGLPLPAFAQGATKTVTTPLGTYDIPLQPKRVVCIDHRTDYEPAYLLGLPVVGHGHWDARDFVPVTEGAADFPMPTTAEVVLALDPDLIICSGEDPSGEWWPAAKMQTIAPVLTTTFTNHWKDDLLQLGDWLDRREAAEAAVKTYYDKVDAMKAKHAAFLNSKKIAAVTFLPDTNEFVAFPSSAADYFDAKEMLLADLGAKSVAREALVDNGFSLENVADILGDMDAILVCDMGGPGLPELTGLPLWDRLPAVQAGNVGECKGYTWYGSYFTAMHFAEAVDELLGRVA